LPHLASIFRFAAAEPCRILVPTASHSFATFSSSLLTSTTALVPDPSSLAIVRSPTREEHVYGIREIGHTVRLKLDIFIVCREDRRPRYGTTTVLIRTRSTTEPKA
jgi:hypothetical protein